MKTSIVRVSNRPPTSRLSKSSFRFEVRTIATGVVFDNDASDDGRIGEVSIALPIGRDFGNSRVTKSGMGCRRRSRSPRSGIDRRQFRAPFFRCY